MVNEFEKLEFFDGGHKAYLWSKSLLKARVILVSEGISDGEAQIMKVEKASTLEEALEMYKTAFPKNPVVLFIPKGSSTIPLMSEN
ncbi:hypothetical protein HNQ41_000559 [Texcoconibacillus texcoconensis]|uniref:Lactate racemase C-terminal domain-containing protein n=2 Tax=Texcoconibacillus texcoconensis TaxID=1095777 RepID=A0A840QM12_9BACI|nr:hypothetical protein [Texcoconibacillus texcoconensis]MBB5172415.1 hypothetical protein [Texcoconibacillus texcoconensis]